MGRPPRALVALAQLAGLWAIGVAEPVLNLLRSGEVAVTAGLRPVEQVALLLAITLLPPAVLVGLELLLGLFDQRLRYGLHLLLIALVLAAFVAYTLKGIDPILGRTRFYAIPTLVGALAVFLYLRAEPARWFLTALGVAPVLLLGSIVLSSGASKLMFPESGRDAAAATPAKRPPVVMLILDELPASSLLDSSGALDARSFPGLARLARRSTWYRNAASVHDRTQQAVPAILTGRRAVPDSPAAVQAYPRNLFTLLGRDYRFDVSEEQTTQLCPTDLCKRRRHRGFPRRVTKLFPWLAVYWMQRVLPDPMVVNIENPDPFGVPTAREQFRRFGASLAPTRPTLFFLHPRFPHQPWEYLPSGKRYRVPPCCDAFLKAVNRVDTSQYLRRHLAQARFADRMVGRLIDRLQRIGLFDRALVIVTADHGVSFKRGVPGRDLARANTPDVLQVPLFLKLPGQRRGRVDDRHARTLDIVPTIADVLGVRVPWRLQGRSLLGRPRTNQPFLATGFEGTRLEIRPTTNERGRDRTARRNAAGFGSKSGADGIYQVAGAGVSLGSSVSAIRTGRSRSRARLDVAPFLRDVEPTSREPAPALLSGSITGLKAGSIIAIGVNGRVRATTSTYRDAGSTRFSALVPDSSFRRGRNRVELLRVRGGQRLNVPFEGAPG